MPSAWRQAFFASFLLPPGQKGWRHGGTRPAGFISKGFYFYFKGLSKDPASRRKKNLEQPHVGAALVLLTTNKKGATCLGRPFKNFAKHC
jgi:hypothetical protein